MAIQNDLLVSIVTPLYNRIHLIGETVASLQNQTYTHWEMVIVDDGSTDGSFEYALELAKEDARIKVFQRQRSPKGAPTCRNIALKNSKGDFCIFLDSDDVLAPFSLEKRVETTKKHAECDFLIFPCLVFNKIPGDTSILWNIDKETNDLDRFLNLDAPWLTCSAIWNTNSLSKILPWDESLSSWQDMDLHVKALAASFKYKKLNTEPDVFYRQGAEDQISKSDKLTCQYYARIKLGENIVDYLLANDRLNGHFKQKIIRFYVWICLKFIGRKHFEGINTAISSLYKSKIINFFLKEILLNLFKLHYYFTYRTFERKIPKIVRGLWLAYFLKIFFPKLPPWNSTVKTIKYKAKDVHFQGTPDL